MPKIFGREPIAVVAVIEALLILLVSFDQLGLGNEWAGLIMGVVNALAGILVGWTTRDTRLALCLGLLKALIAVAAGVGWNITHEQLTGLVLLTTTAVALWQRTQTAPLAKPSFGEPTVVKGEVLASAIPIPGVESVQPTTAAPGGPVV